MPTTLYRAAAPGLTAITGLTSWTTSSAYAAEYAAGRVLGFGGRCLYRGTATGLVIDLRVDARDVLLALGLDLDDYTDETPQDLYRALAGVFRAHGYQWAAFRERPEPEYDEWLLVGDDTVAVSLA